ncbi:hypothetical protein S83_003819 [Arachis hypogaea]
MVDTEEEEAVAMVLAAAAVGLVTWPHIITTEEAEAVVEAATTVGILGFYKGLPNKLSLKNDVTAESFEPSLFFSRLWRDLNYGCS